MAEKIETPRQLWPYQSEGVDYAIKKKRLIIADEMGLGKTVQALVTVDRLEAYPCVVVCPASVKHVWKKMIGEWLPGVACVIVDSKSDLPVVQDGQKVIFVMNYDILSKFAGKITGGIRPKSVIGDEAHYVKNKKAKRTKAFRSIAKGADTRLLLTGTPIENRPSEYLSLLEILNRSQDLGGSWFFLNRYCNAHRDKFGFWDFSGSSNLLELNGRLRDSCYIRRLKRDVQKDLPEQRREVVPVELSNKSDYLKAQKDVISWLLVNKSEAAAFKALKAEAMVEIETLKQLSARGKIEAAKEWIRNMIDSGEKLVVFTHHLDVAHDLAALFSNEGILVTGQDSQTNREASIEAFRLDPAYRLMVISIGIGGVGIDLTVASNCLFMELGWTPSAHDQAESRLHRYGQRSAVTSWYMVGEGTIEEEILRLLERKRAIISEAVDGRAPVGDVDVLDSITEYLRQLA